tara:strand:+ start:169 stop:459 length:291 start_codon:yes stop_codon:yes gene_type:complete
MTSMSDLIKTIGITVVPKKKKKKRSVNTPEDAFTDLRARQDRKDYKSYSEHNKQRGSDGQSKKTSEIDRAMRLNDDQMIVSPKNLKMRKSYNGRNI